jgi:hypothetical protein
MPSFGMLACNHANVEDETTLNSCLNFTIFHVNPLHETQHFF